MRTLIAFLVLTFSISANAALIVEADQSVDNQTLVVDPLLDNSLLLEADLGIFAPGFDPRIHDKATDFFNFPIYARIDLVLDIDASVFTNGSVALSIWSNGFTVIFPGVFIFDKDSKNRMSLWGTVLSDSIIHYLESGAVNGLGFELRPVALDPSGPGPTAADMVGSSIVFGEGNRLRFSDTLPGIGVSEPPLVAILAFGLAALGYRRHVANK